MPESDLLPTSVFQILTTLKKGHAHLWEPFVVKCPFKRNDCPYLYGSVCCAFMAVDYRAQTLPSRFALRKPIPTVLEAFNTRQAFLNTIVISNYFRDLTYFQFTQRVGINCHLAPVCKQPIV
jgi:hypothetical protein